MELQIQDLVSSIKRTASRARTARPRRSLPTPKAQAEKIVADARSEADKLRADAQAEIGVFKASAQLSAEQAKRDAVLAFRQEIGAELTKLLAQDTHKALDDKALAALITAALQGEDASAYAAEVASVTDALKKRARRRAQRRAGAAALQKGPHGLPPVRQGRLGLHRLLRRGAGGAARPLLPRAAHLGGTLLAIITLISSLPMLRAGDARRWITLRFSTNAGAR